MNEIQKVRSHRFATLIGLELKAGFVRAQISQTEVADKLGHSRSGYSKWLNAKPSMPVEALLNTCELIGVDPREIVNAAYERLVEEMGEYSEEEDAMLAAHPEAYGLVANKDANKNREREVDDFGA